MMWIDSMAFLLTSLAGALVWMLTSHGWAGFPVCLVGTWLYLFILRERIEERVTRRQRAYDATPDGRLTTHH